MAQVTKPKVKSLALPLRLDSSSVVPNKRNGDGGGGKGERPKRSNVLSKQNTEEELLKAASLPEEEDEDLLVEESYHITPKMSNRRGPAVEDGGQVDCLQVGANSCLRNLALGRGRRSSHGEYSLTKPDINKAWHPQLRPVARDNHDLSRHLLTSNSSSKQSPLKFNESSHLADTLGKVTQRDRNLPVDLGHGIEDQNAEAFQIEDSEVNFILFMRQRWALIYDREERKPQPSGG